MPHPDKVLDGIVEAAKQSSSFSGGGYRTRELDLDDEDARIEQPVVVLKPLSNSRVTSWDTDVVGYETDADGNRTGVVKKAAWNMAIESHILVAVGNDDFDARSVGLDFVSALLPYDTQQDAKPLPDPEGGTLEDVSLSIGDGEPDNEIGGVGIRKWRQEVETHFEAFTRTVDYPTITDIVQETNVVTA